MKKVSSQFTHDFILRDFKSKKEKNPGYSLRAYARFLGVDSSLLSKVMLGKRPISAKLALRINTKLNLSSVEISDDKNFQNVELDHFRLISDWYHYAILELVNVHKFKNDVGWIASSLGLPKSVVADAIERLRRLGFLKEGLRGQWICAAPTTTVGHKFTEPALQLFQKQILEQAIEALQKTPFEERDQSTITMCIDSAKLPRAKEKIKEFRRGLMKFLEGSKKRDRVYQMSISLFPVSEGSTAE